MLKNLPKTFLLKAFLTFLPALVLVQSAWGQCTNSSPFGTVTAPTNTVPLTITTCAFGGEYNTINSAVAGQTYQFTGSGGTGNYLTVRQGTPGGAVLAHGFSPISATVTVSGPIYLHVNTTAGCGTDGTCHTTTITCTSCGGGGGGSDPCTSITNISCGSPVTAAPTGAGLWNVTACGFSTPGQEKIYSYTPTVTGVHNLQVNSVSGGYIDYFYKAASGGCNSTGWTCIDDINFTGTFPIGSLTAGTTYYFLLDPEGTGIYSHNFQIVCPIPDPCTSISTLTCGTAVSTTQTGTGIWSPASCGFSTPGVEKIYSFTPAITGIHQLQVNSASGGYIDYFYKDAAGGCNNSGWTCIDDISFATTVTIGTLTAGTTYYFLLDPEVTTSVTQNFQIVCPVPFDPCASISTLTCGTAVSTTQSGTGIWSPGSCGFSTPGQEKIYSFTPTVTGIHQLQVNSTSGSYIDYFYKAASGGCNSSGWTCIDDVVSSGTVNIGTLTAGTTYYFLLDPESTASVTHNFQIVCPVPFDPCANITTLACDAPVSSTQVDAGIWSPLACGFSTPGKEKIYSFTAGITGPYSLQVNSTSGGIFIDYMYKAASGGCNSSGWTCIDDILSPGTAAIGTLTAGTTYYILLDPESTASVTHDFQIVCPPGLPSCVGSPSSPTNGQSGICPSPTETLSWSIAPGATSYDVYFGTSPTPPFVGNTTSTTYLATTSGSGTYYWQIVPRNITGPATGCSVWSFTKSDAVAPTITCPANITTSNTTNTCGAVVTYSISATDNCSAPTLVQLGGPSSGATFPVGTTAVTWRAIDASNNSASCAFNVIVNDTQLPTITCPANIATSNNTNVCGAVVTYSISGSDNCTAPTLVQLGGLASGATFPVGVTTNTWRATDASNNTRTCSFTVTVNDTQLPNITCPANITVQNTPNVCGAVVTYSVSGTDNCTAPTLSLTGGLLSGSTFPVGVTTNTWRATDASNNTRTCSFTVTVNDTQAPTITCPANIVRNNDPGECDAVVTYANATATDNCSAVVTRISGAPSGSEFPVGVSIIVFQAKDPSNNTATCSFTIRVNDVEPPVVTCPGPLNLPNDAGQCGRAVNWVGQATFTDNCGGTFNQSNNPGYFPVGDHVVIHTVRDYSGNEATCSQNVTVYDQEYPGIYCPQNMVVTTDEFDCVATVNYAATGYDNCPGYNITYSTDAPATFEPGYNNVTATITDGAGNSTSCTFQIRVNTRKEECNDYDDDCDGLIDESEDWDRVAKVLAGDGSAQAQYGLSVDVEGDYAIVGSNKKTTGGEPLGAAYILRRTPNGWAQMVKLLPSEVEPSDLFGASVAIHGNIAAVGAPNDDDPSSNEGAVYVFYRNASDNWVLVKKVKASDADANDNFGVSVALHGDRLLVGANLDDEKGVNAGAAYMFYQNQGGADNWGQVAKMLANTGTDGDNMGISAALDGDHALVGATGVDRIFQNTGAAFVFGRNETGPDAWGEIAKIASPSSTQNDNFGVSVGISGSFAIVGADQNDQKGADAGAAFIFYRNQNNFINSWGLSRTLLDPNGAAGDHFGSGVGIDGDYAVVSARSDNPFGNASGRGFVFLRLDNNWVQVDQLTDGGGQAGDNLGSAAAISGNTIILGAPLDNNGTVPAEGSVVIFEGICAEDGNRPAARDAESLSGKTAVQCFPVPFSDLLNIEIRDVHSSEVYISVINALGQEVANLYQGEMEGDMTFQWRPAANIAQGIYFLRVKAGAETIVKTIVLAH